MMSSLAVMVMDLEVEVILGRQGPRVAIVKIGARRRIL